jgi:hypothetical protein
MYMKCYIGKGLRDGLDNAENRSVHWAGCRCRMSRSKILFLRRRASVGRWRGDLNVI